MAIPAPAGTTRFAAGSASPIAGTVSLDARRKRQKVVVWVHCETTTSAPTPTLTFTKQAGGTKTITQIAGSPASSQVSGSPNEHLFGFELNDADIYEIVGSFSTYDSTVTFSTTGAAPRGLQAWTYYVTGVDQSASAWAEGGATSGTTASTTSVSATAGCLVVAACTANSTGTHTPGSGWTEFYQQSATDSQDRSFGQYKFQDSSITPDMTLAATTAWAMAAILHVPYTTVTNATADDTTPSYGQTITLTVSGLASDVQAGQTVHFDFTQQTIASWSISGGSGTIGVTFDNRTNLAAGSVVDIRINENGSSYEKISTDYLTLQPRSGSTWVDLSGTVETDPTAGLATWFTPDLIVADQIAYPTTSGIASVTVGPDSTVSVGAGYVVNTAIMAEGYDASTGLWEIIYFALNNTGLVPATGAAAAVMGMMRHRDRKHMRGR